MNVGSLSLCKMKFSSRTLMYSKMYSQLLVVFFAVMCTAKVVEKPSNLYDSERPVGKIPPDLSVENLQLADSSSRRGRTTQSPVAIIPVTTTPHPVLEDSDTVLYRLENSDGKACILILSDAIVEIDFITNLKEKREVSVFVPSQYKASGKCEGDDAQFQISWTNFAWTVFFSKTPGGDHWYVVKMTVDADTQDKHLAHINRPPSILHFESKNQGPMMFPTPVGQSFTCDDELSVELVDGDINAKVLLRKLKMQPFIFKNDFGPEHACTRGGAKSYRDETAPIAVGSTLAIVSILTVSGYGIYRYMKVKKVQYDTME